MRFHKITSLVLVIAVLAGCSSSKRSFSFDVENPPDFLNRIYWFSFAYQSTDWNDIVISTLDQRFDNDTLQKAAAEIPVEYPLNNDYRVALYSWALRDICMEMGLFSGEYVPSSAYCHTDDIIYILYGKPENENRYSEEPVPVAIVSAVDGHVIHFEISR